MKAKELIEKLQAFDPEKEVFIEQGEDYNYMKAQAVRELELSTEDFEEEVTAIVIDYC